MRHLPAFIILAYFVAVCALPNSHAQYKQEILYDGMTGQILLDRLVDGYKPIQVLNYGEARDVLYANIYLENDSVHCVYSDHTLHLPTGVDPSTHLLQNGGKDGINTEHAYPRSKGAEFGNPKSDMHHLFPTRAEVNSRRSNFPFQEIEDAQTLEWFYKDFSISNIPSKNIDAYSEWRVGGFEPPEHMKGNIARACFYFYTMYRTEAVARDASFFPSMQETLCEWHLLDPVDSLEWLRTKLISIYQSNKSNPFVLDCTLPERSYCQNMGLMCDVTQAHTLVHPDELSLQFFPNPAIDDAHLRFSLEYSAAVSIQIIAVDGRTAYSESKQLARGFQQIDLPLSHLPRGTYYLLMRVKRGYGADLETVLPFVK